MSNRATSFLKGSAKDAVIRSLGWSRELVTAKATPVSPMLELRYQQYVIGKAGGVWTNGTLKELLFAMPYLMTDLIPPLRVLNGLLRNGVPNHIYPDGLPDGKVQFDAGMSGGCAWKPFEIADNEYEELVLELLTEPDGDFRQQEPPPEIATIKQWQRWAFNQRARARSRRHG